MKSLNELYVDGIHPSVAALNFATLMWKLSKSTDASMSELDVENVVIEYRKFLTLKKLYPGVELVPNKQLDKFWHAHILDTQAYHRDCQSIFGYYLHHFPYFGIYGEDDQNDLACAFEETKKLYERHFGPYPIQLDSASRCKDHPCHVPTSCKCRAEGTCR